jgi:hypothetical protein
MKQGRAWQLALQVQSQLQQYVRPRLGEVIGAIPVGRSFGIDDCLECFHRGCQRVHAALRLDAPFQGWHRGRVAT